MNTITYTGTLTTIECGNCHIYFAMPEDMWRDRRNDGKVFYCPRGCGVSYHETENTKLRAKAERAEANAVRLRAQLDQERAALEHEKSRVNGYKGALAKSKKRAAAGVCPAPGCKRHFANVRAHVVRMHPDYATEVSL